MWHFYPGKESRLRIKSSTERAIDFLFVDRQNYPWLSEAGLETIYENASYLIVSVPD